MELNQIIAWAGSLIVGIGVVWKVISKFSGKARRYFSIAKNSLDLLTAVLDAVEDQKIDEVEVATIRKEANELITSLKK